MTMLIKSALARSLLDHKVTLIDFMWMSNHCHLLLITWDAQEASDFYGELQKNISEYVKRLLGLPRLSLWEGRPTVAIIPDLKTAMARKTYFYLNPCRAHLVDSVEKYPGYSSWRAFHTSKNCLTFRVSERVPFFPQSAVPTAPTRDLTERQEKDFISKLAKGILCHHRINIFPNLWAAVFGITDPDELAAYNADIAATVKATETFLKAERLEKGHRVIGEKKLLHQPIMLPHVPKSRSRKVFVICGDWELRKRIIDAMNVVEDLCIQCYLEWKRGNYTIQWPPGTFRPPMPPVANAVGPIQ
jgi:REP element-mobilizing transposase RayT